MNIINPSLIPLHLFCWNWTKREEYPCLRWHRGKILLWTPTVICLKLYGIWVIEWVRWTITQFSNISKSNSGTHGNASHHSAIAELLLLSQSLPSPRRWTVTVREWKCWNIEVQNSYLYSKYPKYILWDWFVEIWSNSCKTLNQSWITNSCNISIYSYAWAKFNHYV